MTTLDPDQIAEVIRIANAVRPRPEHVTRDQAAKMLNVSAPTLRRLIVRGVLKPNACGRIPITQIDAALAAQ